MSHLSQPAGTRWSSLQAYGLAVICLLVGIAVGYLGRSSSAPKTAAAPAAATAQGLEPGQQPTGNPTQQPAPAGNPAQQMPPGHPATQAATQQPSKEDLKRMAAKAVAPLLEQLKRNPNDAGLQSQIGADYMRTAQYADAVPYFEKASRLKPSAGAFTSLANAQAYSGNADAAIANLNSALGLDPKYADALFNMGMLKWQAKGDVKGAIACWEKLLKTNPDHPNLDVVRQLIAHVKGKQAPQATAAQ
jgi:tetratricopeptide (TPR) repeat protein